VLDEGLPQGIVEIGRFTGSEENWDMDAWRMASVEFDWS